ncbi:MAG: LLM class flavin-dependent oxidoreductase [Actinobacteria bacterium]|nr:LLM class flavin-dependent oxidoreductase [Actinomycetota bacterium]
MTTEHVHLAVALDGAGFHPAAWRHPSASPDAIFTAGYWAELAATAERGRIDFLTIEDSFGLQSSQLAGPDGRTDHVRGRLDATVLAARLAPLTRHIGLVPTAVTTHTEPFHIASAIATLDYVSKGRAGWRPQVSWRVSEAQHVGRRQLPDISPTSDDPAARTLVTDLFDEAADSVEVVRRLWDSWEDDAIIKDEATGRYVDRDRLHYVDFEGRFFSVKGPSIVPRPPQGNPLVAALAHSRIPLEFAARSADVVFVTPSGAGDVPNWVGQVRDAERSVGRAGAPLKILADLVVFLDESETAAADRKHRLDELDGDELRTDASVFVGTPEALAAQLNAWQSYGIDGFRLRPGVLPHDLEQIVDRLVPALQRRGTFRTEYGDETLRERLGLARPASRYATALEDAS